MDKEFLKQSLSDSGCSNEVATSILERFESGNIDEMVRLMKKERCRAMDEYHECGRRVDCMDFILRRIDNKIKQK